ncbi:MAG: ABC transporter ATP-binding protein, partial [Ktedonobacterales bacterium]
MRQPTTHTITFDEVSFAYQKAAVVERVSLRVAAGEMVALLGPNGAGKSTLLKLATGILRPTRGQIRIGERDLRTMSRDEVARRMAVVPQDFSVQFAYTVRQIVELGRLPHLGAWGLARAGDQQAVDAALRETDTVALAGRVFNELSGGERQRVLIALALAQDAGIVLLDEPTAHLDIRHQIEVLALLRRLNEEHGLTVVAALHDLN